MKSTIKIVLVLILSSGWAAVSGQSSLEPDTLGPYSVHGFVQNQQHMPLSNVRVTVTNWDEEYTDVTGDSGYFTIQFPVEKLDYNYNRRVHVELSTRDAAYLKKSVSIPVRQFKNGEYIIEAARLNTRTVEPGPGVDWEAINSLQSEIDSLRSQLEKYAKYPGIVDSLQSLIAGLENQQDTHLREYVVKPGDYLRKIASDPSYYGTPEKWRTIYEANREIIEDPNLIYPKQVLKIPTVSTTGE